MARLEDLKPGATVKGILPDGFIIVVNLSWIGSVAIELIYKDSKGRLADVARINQLISNAASHLVRSPLTVNTENVALGNGLVVILLTIPKGIDKPYFDKNRLISPMTMTAACLSQRFTESRLVN